METIEYGPPISLGAAKKIIEAAEAEASANRWAVVIAIVDSTGHLVALHKMDHAQLGSIAVAQAKALTAVNFKRPTKALADTVADAASACDFWQPRISAHWRAAFPCSERAG